jgi:hypothetical protein
VLFEALTGAVPFVGMPLEVLMRKQRDDAPSPRVRAPGAPADLVELCAALLERHADARPGGSDVIARLGGAVAVPMTLATPPSGHTTAPPFVGRRKEQAQLREALAAARDGHAVLVALTGESGVGKSALARHFAERVRLDEPETVVLEARCFERESAHFKAADGLMESLASYLSRRPPDEVAALMPLKVGLLTQLFPSMLRVDAIARAPLAVPYVKDPQELRQRVFTAFRELLQRLSERRPLILLIDDLHWADADSLALLGATLRPPGAPGALALCTARKLPDAVRDMQLDVREVPLDVLPQEQAADLAAALLRRAGGAEGADPVEIAREAGGQPMFIDELVRHVAAHGPGAGGARRLEDAIWSRISGLPTITRRTLELVAMAGTPLRQDTAAVAAGLSGDELQRQIAALRAANLVRTSGARVTDLIEPFHGRIRDVLLDYLDPEHVRELHRALAVAIEATDRDDDESLADHWAGAGDPRRAAEHADRASARAFENVAFDRAARMAQTALTLGDFPPERRAKLWRRLAEAHANAGHGRDAAAAFLDAASLARPAEALALRRRAAEQFLRVGFIDEGVAIAREVLAAVGEPYPASSRRALLSLLRRRAHLRLRGLGFRERDESQVSASKLAVVDACWSLGQGLATVDFLRGADFQARHLLRALDAGEPYRIARGLAIEAAQAAVKGERSGPRVDKLLGQARGLAERSPNPQALGIVLVAQGVSSFLRGRWREATATLDAAEAHLRDKCVDVAWDLASAQCFAMWGSILRGDLEDASRRQARIAREAAERANLYLEVNAVVGLASFVWFARDDAEAYRAAASAAMKRWTHQGFQLQHAYDAMAAAQTDLYLGDGLAANRRMTTVWPFLEDSMLLRVKSVRVHAHYIRATAALGAVAAGAPNGEVLLATAMRDARVLEREPGWSVPLGKLVRAGVHAARGERVQADELLEQGAVLAAEHDVMLYACCARLQLARLRGEDGRALFGEASAALARCGVRKPETMADMLVPVAMKE